MMDCLHRERWDGIARRCSSWSGTRMPCLPPRWPIDRGTAYERLMGCDDSAVFHLELAEGHRGHGGDADERGLHGAAGARAGGANPESLGTEPRGPVWAAATAGGWGQTFSQRGPDSDGGVSSAVSHFSGDCAG